MASGNLDWSHGDLNAARSRFEEAARIAVDLGDVKMECGALSNLGLILSNESLYEEALAVYEDCLRKYVEMNDRLNIANIQVNLGGIYTDIGNLEAAEESLIASVPVLSELEVFGSLMTALLNLSDLSFKRSNYALAMRYSFECLNLSIDQQNELHVRLSLLELATVFVTIGYFESAIETLAAEEHVRSRAESKRTVIQRSIFEGAWNEIQRALPLPLADELWNKARYTEFETLVKRILERNTENNMEPSTLFNEGRIYKDKLR